MAALCVPMNFFLAIDSHTRALGVSVCLLLFTVFQFFPEPKKVNIYSVDIWWVVLILYTGLSSLWSINASYAIYGMFTTILMYLCYRAFESVDWGDGNIRNWVYWVVFACLVIALASTFFLDAEATAKGSGINNVSNFSVDFIDSNRSILEALIITLLPFILFTKKKYSRFSSPLVLAFTLILFYILGSHQSFTILLLLSIIYTLYIVDYKRKYKYLVLVGFLGLIAGSLYLQSFSFNPKFDHSILKAESPSHINKVKIWENSFELFKKSPIVGHGKNNWALAIGHFGLEDYAYNTASLNSPKILLTPHNSILSVLSEGGLIGLLIYLYIGILPLLRLFNERKLLTQLEIAASVSIVLFLILTLFHGNIYSSPNNFGSLSIIVIMALAILSNKSNQSVHLLNTNAKLLKKVPGASALACLIYFLM